MNWPSAARLASAFTGVGADVAALYPPGHVLASSRFPVARHLYSPLAPLASVARALSRSTPDLVVPCDDRALSLLVRLGSRYGVVARSLGALESYPKLAARGAFIDAARALGIAAPETIAVADEAAFEAALARLGLPAVLKSDGSWGGAGVVIARSTEQARAMFRRLSATPSRLRSLARAALRRDAHFLHEAIRPAAPAVSLQRFVAGTPATSAFACWKGRVLATIHMDVLETITPTGSASVMRRSDCREMEVAAIKIAERFGLSGLHGLDFVRDSSGRPHLVEINPPRHPGQRPGPRPRP
ncbi:MAG: ATP-grasp domain-containing protein [Rhizomicrobium sp.]